MQIDPRGPRFGALITLAMFAVVLITGNVWVLTVQAAMTGNRQLVHAAVALDPLTSSLLTLPQIHEMADRMLAAEAEWLPELA